MGFPRHLRNRPAVRQPASSRRASDLPQKQFGSRVCTNDTQCNERPPFARWPDLTYPAAALVARIRLRLFASLTKNRKSSTLQLLHRWPEHMQLETERLILRSFHQ